MNIKINSVHFDADKKLIDFVNNKVKKLFQFYEDIVGAEIFLRLENTQELENKIAEIKLEIPGNDLFAKKQSKSFEEAVDNAVDALKRQIRKHKDKLKRA
ncbi:MAG TPA: ribosome-associated translation inhibitor RaiA [Bacteroidales bacterium]|nr:ribosome-associated translation inhibitor RaiA [Bacteroidales bacterium]